VSKNPKFSRAWNLLSKIQKHTGGEVKISDRNVPHLVVDKHSVAYFMKRDSFRVFYLYMEFDKKQTKKDFKTWLDVANYLTDIKVSKILNKLDD